MRPCSRHHYLRTRRHNQSSVPVLTTSLFPGSEFWGAIAAISWIHREFPRYEVCLLIDNDQVVSTDLKRKAFEPSPFREDTWTIAVHSALRLIVSPLNVLWIKGHANFFGNEISDSFSKWAAHRLIFTPDLPPPPPLGSVAVHHLPLLHKIKAQQFRHLLPQHSHNNIAIGPSFSLHNMASWFSSLFFKFAAGCYNVHSYQWSNMPQDYPCPMCRQHHPLDPVSCLAFCTALDQHVRAYTSSPNPHSVPWFCTGGSLGPQRATAGTSREPWYQIPLVLPISAHSRLHST